METENTTAVEVIDFDFSTQYSLQTNEELTEQTYQDTKRKNPHRRKITIYKQDANVMEVDIESYPPDGTLNEDGTPQEQDGTPITAEIMDAFHKVIAQADKNAKSSFNMTREVANKVATYLEQSNQNVLNLEQQITQSQGTKVQVNGEYVASFDANTKVDQTTYESTIDSLDVRVSNLEAKEILTNVTYDSTTNTFNF